MSGGIESDESVVSGSADSPNRTFSYGPEPDHQVDVYSPVEIGVEPAICLIHGGFWRQEYDRAHCRPMAARLAELGYAVFVPEYRRVGGNGGWPHTFDDLRSALAAIGSQSERLLLVGHSAGGQLALWLAVCHQTPEMLGVLALAPVADLVEAEQLKLDAGAVRDLMGGTALQFPDRYRMVNPAAYPAPSVATAIVHGADDNIVPVHMSHNYVKNRPGVALEVPECGHFELIDPQAPEFAHVVAALGVLR
ncbi:MAG TPA: alpha/beta hydrolase [Actinomycetes bacterium]|nr:alpha/beta hydrolase [Actinomycetes bacterium]